MHFYFIKKLLFFLEFDISLYAFLNVKYAKYKCIDMFTSLLGLGDLAAKVTKIFTKIKDRVTGAVDGLIKNLSLKQLVSF